MRLNTLLNLRLVAIENLLFSPYGNVLIFFSLCPDLGVHSKGNEFKYTSGLFTVKHKPQTGPANITVTLSGLPGIMMDIKSLRDKNLDRKKQRALVSTSFSPTPADKCIHGRGAFFS